MFIPDVFRQTVQVYVGESTSVLENIRFRNAVVDIRTNCVDAKFSLMINRNHVTTGNDILRFSYKNLQSWAMQVYHSNANIITFQVNISMYKLTACSHE